MPRTKPKSDRGSRNGAEAQAAVLTLAEVAAYLRVKEEEVLRLLREQGLPGRRVGEDWRFLKSAVENWLSSPESADSAKFWQTHFGALRDDPYLEDIVREAYRNRGRPEDGAL